MCFRCRSILCTLAALLIFLCGCHGGPPSEDAAFTAQEQSAEPAPAEEITDVSAEPDEPEAAEPEPEPEYDHHENYMRASGGFFRPDEPLLRAECAQLLCNLTGAAASEEAVHSYADVPSDRWYSAAVSAAAGFFQETGYFFRPEEPVTVSEFLSALSLALWGEEAAPPEALTQAAEACISEFRADSEAASDPALTRAETAVLLNRALGRTPDAQAAAACTHSLLLDVSEDRADYAEILEAVFPHEYYRGDVSEVWHDDALAEPVFRSGVYLSGESGYVVDESGRVLRGSGLLDYGGRRYLRADETGRIYADGSLHPCEDKAVFAGTDGALLRGCTMAEYAFDADGFYTTGQPELDEKLDGFISACTASDMTREEKLRACYDAVRSFQYLGRNPAYSAEVKTIPYDKQLEFADKILTTGKGDCYNFAAVFCLLARRLGYPAKAVLGECAYAWNWNGIAHGWDELTIGGEVRLFDPQIENYNLRAGISNDYFGAYNVTYETAYARYLKH